MERGPMALFGAIVAVGLGPALWLGAQFGTASVNPATPPAVVGEQRVDVDKAPGGAGAAPEEQVIEPTRRSGYRPLSSTPSPRPSRTTESEGTDPAEAPTTGPATTTDPTPTGDPTTPPADGTGEPTEPPADGDGDTGEPTGPAPPAPGDPAGDKTDVTLAGR